MLQLCSRAEVRPVVPSWQGKWRKLQSGMQLLRSRAKGYNLFSAPQVGNSFRRQLGPMPWDFRILGLTVYMLQNSTVVDR